jgi:hypothetical protein
MPPAEDQAEGMERSAWRGVAGGRQRVSIPGAMFTWSFCVCVTLP